MFRRITNIISGCKYFFLIIKLLKKYVELFRSWKKKFSRVPEASHLKQSWRIRGKLMSMLQARAYATVAFSSVGTYRKVGTLQLPRRELTPTLVLKNCHQGSM
jgi:hypothetical protein